MTPGTDFCHISMLYNYWIPATNDVLRRSSDHSGAQEIWRDV
jgi:hypothetical protein